MGYGLRSGLSFCVAGSRPVFLDLENDKYFCLPLTAEPVFQQLLQGETPLGDRDVDVIASLEAQGILVEMNGRSSLSEARAEAQPVRRSLEHSRPSFSIAGSAHALAYLQVARWKLKRRGAPAMLRIAHQAKAPLGCSPQDIDEGLAAISASFDQMGLLLTAHEQCLPRSLALSACLSAKRYAHELIIGVKMRPFDAHCWVQVGDTVVNDALDRTSIFTPILVL